MPKLEPYTGEVPVILSEPVPPKVVQIISHLTQLYALTSTGDIWMREQNSKDFNQGPNHQPVFDWRRIPSPNTMG